MYVTLSALSWDRARLELEAQPRHRPVLRAAVRRRPVEERQERRQAPLLRRRLAAVRRHPRRAGRELGVEGQPAARRDQAAQGHHVPGEARRDGGARVRRRRRGVQLQAARQAARARSRATSTTSPRSRRPTSTRWSSPSRTSSPSGTTASATGYFSGIYPKEVVDAGATNWKNVNGTGPFMLTDFVQGNSNTYAKNPNYWDKEKINGAEYKLPFVDKLVYRTIKDEATFITALRTGKLDILETIRWQNVDELKKSAPQLKWSTLAQHVGHLPGVPGRHQAVRRHPRAPRAQHGGQQEGDRQGLLQRQRRALRLPDAPRLQGLLRAAGGHAGERQGAVRVQPRPRPRSCWPRPATRTASPSRCRCARATPTTWTCCRWSPPTSRRSASRSRSSPWSMPRSSRP